MVSKLSRKSVHRLDKKKNDKTPEIQLFAENEETNTNGKIFNEEDHFPEKMKNCKYCRVCHKALKKKKTKYRCKACSDLYGKDIAMCVDKCFRVYHLDRESYNQRKKPIRKKTESYSWEKVSPKRISATPLQERCGPKHSIKKLMRIRR